MAKTKKQPRTFQEAFRCPYPPSQIAEDTFRAILTADDYVPEMTATEYKYHIGIFKWAKKHRPSIAQRETVEDIAKRHAGYRPPRRRRMAA